VPKQPWPYVIHYSFHILDPDWGHLTIKMSGHPPFGAQVMLNGHEYVACQAQKAGIDFRKQDNCFTTTPNAADLAQALHHARKIHLEFPLVCSYYAVHTTRAPFGVLRPPPIGEAFDCVWSM
jgi:hypothetical protein